MLEGTDKILETTGKVIDKVPEVYDDAFKDTVKESGKTLALIPRTINAALVPLRKWISEKEYSLAETEKLLELKLKNVDVEKITTPNAYVAVPALQAISYCIDSEELRNLYANLLAKSMNLDTKESVHPSFVEIIKQMSPLDAIIFKDIYISQITPLINLYITRENGGNTHHFYNISWLETYSYESFCISINNLERLGLIEIPYGESYSEDENYNWVRGTQTYNVIKQQLLSLNMGTIGEDKGYIKKTSLAKAFYETCVVD